MLGGCCKTWYGRQAIYGDPQAGVPVNSVAPVASDSGGGLLTTTTGTWSGFAEKITYQWYRDNVLISGATSATYQTSMGGTYKVEVNEININGPGTAVFSNDVVI